ncbi:MAG: hypothetical protein HGA94_00055 [Candidatus Aminicenantes bacterium]|nr:hypothetical protein [Candidatus Aminicenantes bacterium]
MEAVPLYRRSTRLALLAGLVLGAVSSLSSAVVFDFVQKAPEAKWARSLSAIGELPWNGPANDGRGFARHVANAALESGKSFALVLETHPEWKANGLITGVYANIAVPATSFEGAVVTYPLPTATDNVDVEPVVDGGRRAFRFRSHDCPFRFH